MVSAIANQHVGVSAVPVQMPTAMRNSALIGEQCLATTATIGSSEGSIASTLGTSSEGLDDKVLLICDPATKQKISIPFGLTEQTSGRVLYFQNLANPTRRESHVCMLYQKGKCRSNVRCNQVHVDRGHIARLRAFYFELNIQKNKPPDNSHKKSLELVVQDPKSPLLKLVIPYSKTEDTTGRDEFLISSKSGTQTRDFSLCADHLNKISCKKGTNCKFIHANLDLLSNVQDVDSPCCQYHGEIQSDVIVSDTVQLVMINKVSQRCKLPRERIGTTSGLREIVATNPSSQSTIVFCSNRVCRLHQEKRCHHGVGCSNLHVCRTAYALLVNATVPSDVRISNKLTTVPLSGILDSVVTAPIQTTFPPPDVYSNITTVQSADHQNIVPHVAPVEQVHHHHQQLTSVQHQNYHQQHPPVSSQHLQSYQQGGHTVGYQSQHLIHHHHHHHHHHNHDVGYQVNHQSVHSTDGCVTGMPLTPPVKDTFGIPLVTREGNVPSHLLPPSAVGAMKTGGATGIPLTSATTGVPLTSGVSTLAGHHHHNLSSSCNTCGARAGSLERGVPVGKNAASIPYADSEPSQTPPISPKQLPLPTSGMLQQCYSHQKLPLTQSFSQQNDPYLNAVPLMSSQSIVQVPAPGLPPNSAMLPHTWSEVVRQAPTNNQQHNHQNSAYFSRQHAREFILQPELQVHDSFVDPTKAVLTSPCVNPAYIPHKA